MPPNKTGYVSKVVPMKDEFETYLKMGLYGEPGAGKSTFASTFPGKILWFLPSGIKKPGELMSLNTKELRSKIDKFVPTTKEELFSEIGYQREQQKLLGEKYPYKTFVLDNTSGLERFLLRNIMNLEEMPEQSKFGEASMDQHRNKSHLFKEVIRGLLNFDLNVVIIAHEEKNETDKEKQEDKPKFVNELSLSKSAHEWFTTELSFITRVFTRQKMIVSKKTVMGKEVEVSTPTEDIEYCMQIKPNSKSRVKFRVPPESRSSLDKVLIDPKYQDLEKILKLEGN